MAGRIAAFLVFSILLHGFLFHNSLWKSNRVRLPHSHAPSSVQVKVLVESLCIDSKHFVEQQLSPVYEALGPAVISLQLVPFGNAQIIPETDSSAETVECQHGPAECDANAFQQCVALSLYPNSEQYFPFFECLYKSLTMGTSDEFYERRLFEVCARRSNLDWRRIAACRDDVDQMTLLQRKASSLTPDYHQGLPWVEIEGKHVEIPAEEDESSFLNIVCEAYRKKGGDHPVCSSSRSV